MTVGNYVFHGYSDLEFSCAEKLTKSHEHLYCCPNCFCLRSFIVADFTTPFTVV